jgi:DNA-binding PadR family transcriptional regulator
MRPYRTGTKRRPSELEFQLLAIVSSGELSGRDVARRFKAEEGRNLSNGTLYTTLQRMEDLGWVAVRVDEGNRTTRLFKLTRKGREVLARQRDGYLRLSRFGVDGHKPRL